MVRLSGVRLSGVRKRYRGRGEVLAGIDLELTPGAPVVVLGGNGAGKSTLLRIVAGCSTPTAGRVSGRPPTVGFLPGRFPASSRLPVHGYLRHLAAVRGAAGATATAEAAGLLDELGFTGDRAAPVALLSAGNVQKVGLTQALCCRPDLLVLDEPWTSLDGVAASALDRRLRAEVRRGAVVVVADHTGRAAQLPGSTVLRLSDGVLVPTALDRGAPDRPGVDRDAVEHTVVELRCPGEPVDALRALPPVAGSSVGPGVLTVRVPAGRGDTLLAAALAGGCSVLAVWREDAP